MSNSHKGEVRVEIDGTSYTMRLDMNAMVALEEHFSTPDKEISFAEILDKVQRGNMRYSRAFIWAALQAHHPTLTMEDVSDIVQRSGGVFMFSQRIIAQLAKSTAPDPADIKALGLEGKGKTTNPQKAQARRAGTGALSTSKRAASA